jgi:hypothetical protein
MIGSRFERQPLAYNRGSFYRVRRYEGWRDESLGLTGAQSLRRIGIMSVTEVRAVSGSRT